MSSLKPKRQLSRASKERLEAGIQECFGFEAQLILRRQAEFKAAIKRHPFDERQLREAGKIAIVFLSAVPEQHSIEDLRANNPGREVIQAHGRELFVFYSDGMARSKLDNKRIERQLDLIATARNWNTCIKLQGLVDEYEA